MWDYCCASENKNARTNKNYPSTDDIFILIIKNCKCVFRIKIAPYEYSIYFSPYSDIE